MNINGSVWWALWIRLRVSIMWWTLFLALRWILEWLDWLLLDNAFLLGPAVITCILHHPLVFHAPTDILASLLDPHADNLLNVFRLILDNSFSSVKCYRVVLYSIFWVIIFDALMSYDAKLFALNFSKSFLKLHVVMLNFTMAIMADSTGGTVPYEVFLPINNLIIHKVSFPFFQERKK